MKIQLPFPGIIFLKLYLIGISKSYLLSDLDNFSCLIFFSIFVLANLPIKIPVTAEALNFTILKTYLFFFKKMFIRLSALKIISLS